MKKLIIMVAMTTLSLRGNTQAVNPQNTFSSAVSVGNPSLWLNFNDATPAFKDSVSGTSMGNTAQVTPTSLPATLSSTGSPNQTLLQNVPLPPMTVTKIAFRYYATPTVSSIQIVCATVGGSVLTITNNITLPVAATTATQTLTAPTNFTAFNVSSGEVCGWYQAAMSPGYATGGSAGLFYLSGAPPATGTPTTYGTAGTTQMGLSISGSVVSSGTATVHQPGFDNTNNANYSASFAYNAWNAAPNNTLSTIDWNIPWTMLIHVDRLNWDRTGKLVLASKGDLNTVGVVNTYWEVYLQQNASSGNASQLCFTRDSATGENIPTQIVCSAQYIDIMPNNFNYDIVIEDAGTGNQAGISMWINGTAISTSYAGQAFGFGNVAVTLSGGTGYAATTAYTSTGGGTNCHITGTMYATSGVPTSAYSTGAQVNAGCPYTSFTGTGSGTILTASAISAGAITTGATVTGAGVPSGTTIVSQTSGTPGGVGVYVTSAATTASSTNLAAVPTLVLTSPAGTGVTITAAALPMTMNSSTQPLMVPGYVNNGIFYGPGGTDIAENPLYVDEFALLPGNLTFGQVTSIFYETKFYQNLLYSYTKPPKVILDSCCCGPDFSGDQTIAMVIGAHKAGLIQLVGAVDNDGNPNGQNSVGWWREMLDQAGLNDIGISVGPNSPTANVGGCPAASITAYNASTPQNASSYQSSVTMYRTILAANSTTPVDILLTQTVNGYSAFLQSAADSISSLTGLQLAAQNAANGAIVNLFEGNFSLTPTPMTYLLSNNGKQYLQFIGGTPAVGGPGIYVSHTALDPLYTAAVGTTEDTISGWTNMQIAQILTPYFFGGVLISSSGGTGYASLTAFTSSGGGPSCHVTGLMGATSGVPNNMFYMPWGGTPITASGTMYNGIGYGCTPAIFTATGSGTSLTVSAVSTGVITVGDTINGTGIPTGTAITAQVSGTTGGTGVYTTSVVTTGVAATVTRTPTIILTAPTGTGVTLTPSLTFIAEGYGGANSNQFRVYPSGWAQTSSIGSANAPVYTWFQNSLMDPPTTGAPRPY